MREPVYYWVKVSPDDEWEPIYFNGTYWDNQRWMVDKLFAVIHPSRILNPDEVNPMTCQHKYSKVDDRCIICGKERE